MKYKDTITIKDKRECIIRNATGEDAAEVSQFFVTTHEQTDYLLSYPEEHTFDDAAEARFLQDKANSDRDMELVAIVDGEIAGMAGITTLGDKYKIRHRCELGITVDQNYWGLGIGKALMKACVESAKKSGYSQIELEVVGDNERAIELYRKLGFIEYGRNPKGFQSKYLGFQELVSMRFEIVETE